MGDIVSFKGRRKGPRRGDTLCRSGHHKWVVQKNIRFDVKLGCLVTCYRCHYCGKTKVRAE